MKWSKEEDDLLISIYDKKKNWNELTNLFNSKHKKIKNYKQLNQRWNYFLNPKISLKKFSLEEIKILKYYYEPCNKKNNKKIQNNIYNKTGILRSTHIIKNNITSLINKSRKINFSIEEDLNLYFICKDNDFIWTKVFKIFNNKFKKNKKDIFNLKCRWEFFLKKYTTPNIFTLEQDIKLYNICIDNNIDWNNIFYIFSGHYPEDKNLLDLKYRWYLYLNPYLNPIYTN
tara:strand:- start:1281 stop:1967 length:687 start_codon:yes stop_codon:yes gene_type:complete